VGLVLGMRVVLTASNFSGHRSFLKRVISTEAKPFLVDGEPDLELASAPAHVAHPELIVAIRSCPVVVVLPDGGKPKMLDVYARAVEAGVVNEHSLGDCALG